MLGKQSWTVSVTWRCSGDWEVPRESESVCVTGVRRSRRVHRVSSVGSLESVRRSRKVRAARGRQTPSCGVAGSCNTVISLGTRPEWCDRRARVVRTAHRVLLSLSRRPRAPKCFSPTVRLRGSQSVRCGYSRCRKKVCLHKRFLPRGGSGAACWKYLRGCGLDHSSCARRAQDRADASKHPHGGYGGCA